MYPQQAGRKRVKASGFGLQALEIPEFAATASLQVLVAQQQACSSARAEAVAIKNKDFMPCFTRRSWLKPPLHG